MGSLALPAHDVHLGKDAVGNSSRKNSVMDMHSYTSQTTDVIQETAIST